jgi:hypothetical protein
VLAQNSKRSRKSGDFCVTAIPHGHDHNSFAPRFPALVPCSQPPRPAPSVDRPAPSVDRPAAATPWSASALLH